MGRDLSFGEGFDSSKTGAGRDLTGTAKPARDLTFGEGFDTPGPASAETRVKLWSQVGHHQSAESDGMPQHRQERVLLSV